MKLSIGLAAIVTLLVIAIVILASLDKAVPSEFLIALTGTITVLIGLFTKHPKEPN